MAPRLLHFTQRQLTFAIVSGLAVLGFLAILAIDAVNSRQREISFAESSLQNYSRVLEHQALATSQKIDLALKEGVREFQSVLAGEAPLRHAPDKLLAEILSAIPESQSLRVVNADGNVVFDASGKPPTGNIADRHYFQRNKNYANAGMVISEPIFARFTNNWVITFSRRLENKSGQFVGLIQAAVRAEYFENFYATLDMGALSLIGLYDDHFRLVARYPRLTKKLGEPVGGTRMEELLAAGQMSGNYAASSPLDGVERFYHFRKLESLPFIILVGMARTEVLDQWQRKVWLYGSAGLLLGIMYLIMVVMWQRNFGRVIKRADAISGAYDATIQQMRHMAEHDHLTELPNRAVLDKRLREITNDPSPGQGNPALIMLDLDHFKNINESLGHDIGDRLLQSLAQRLANVCGTEHLVSRHGGDKFAILALGCKDPVALAQFTRLLIDTTRQPCQIDQHEIMLSASAGLALYPQDGESFHALLKNADAAMYHAKEAGRGTFQFFSPEMNARIFERLSLENKLRKALSREEFAVYFQPKFSIADRRLSGFEALLRWHHPDQGMISPAIFIPVAEDTELIRPIGEWVLQQTCRQIKNWQDAGWEIPPISVNLSVAQFRQHNLVERVSQILEETGVAPHCLELEITESVVMENTDHIITILDRFKEMGIGLSLDDFGTGYSSLSTLKRLPVDKLKIDRSFIQHLPDARNDAAITETIIAMAGKLNRRVVAEGVETEEQMDFLRERGCHEAQGFLFSQAVPAVEAERFLTLRH